MLVDAGGAVGAGAVAELDSAEIEMLAKIVPFGVGGLAVFLTGALSASTGDEGLEVLDDLFGVDGDVAAGGLEG